MEGAKCVHSGCEEETLLFAQRRHIWRFCSFCRLRVEFRQTAAAAHGVTRLKTHSCSRSPLTGLSSALHRAREVFIAGFVDHVIKQH